MDFLLSPDVQKALPDSMFVFPVREGTPLPATWARFAVQPKHPLLGLRFFIDLRRDQLHPIVSHPFIRSSLPGGELPGRFGILRIAFWSEEAGLLPELLLLRSNLGRHIEPVSLCPIGISTDPGADDRRRGFCEAFQAFSLVILD